MTSDDERAAREWLQNKADHAGHPYSDKCRTILRLLDRPVCPRGEDVPMPVLEKMSEAYWKVPTNDCGNDMRAAIDALHAHLTAPPEPRHRKVETWAAVSDTGVILLQSEDRSKIEKMVGRLHYRIVKLVEADDDQ